MIVTQHVDNRRSGANLSETFLRPDNIDASQFGKLVEFGVLGAVYAQPLLARRRTGLEPRNLLCVATMHNMVYALDADAPGLVWSTHLAASIPLPDPEIGPPGYKDIEWEVGIVGTPVIDTERDAIWLVTTSRDLGEEPAVINHRLWLLDLDSGRPRRPPVIISAHEGPVTFVSHRQLQRSALLLSQNKIYVAFASYGDAKPYAGWVLSYDADTLAHVGTYCTTREPTIDGMGGIWQSGQGPCADESGNLYFLTGNGDFDPNRSNFGDCAVSLDPDLNLRSFFSPHNNQELNATDRDLGSGGLLAIPGKSMVLGGGKEALLYLMDAGHLGGFDPDGDSVLQKFPVSATTGDNHIHGSPVFFATPSEERVYVWPENDQLKAYRFENDRFFVTPAAQTTITDPQNVPGGARGMPGGFLTVSANGRDNGIVWANHPWAKNLNQMIGEGVLRAFDATTLEQKYKSRDNRARDDFGNFAKFCAPTVADGRVYVATMGGLQRKVTLDETATGGPTLVSVNDDWLLLAWSGRDNPSHLNVIASGDGITWGGKTTLDELTQNPSSVVYGNGRVFVAWTGTDRDHSLNVISTDVSLRDWRDKHTFDERSMHGPALAFGDGRLFLAWTGTDGRLNVVSSPDGVHWDSKQTLDERSPTGPSLAFHKGILYLLWNGTDRRLNIIELHGGELHDWGRAFENKVTLDETSAHHPAMTFGADGLSRLSWTGTDKKLNELMSEVKGISFNVPPTYKRTFDDTSVDGPSLCLFQGKTYVGWTGTDNHLNVAELSRGAVVVYGPLSARRHIGPEHIP